MVIIIFNYYIVYCDLQYLFSYSVMSADPNLRIYFSCYSLYETANLPSSDIHSVQESWIPNPWQMIPLRHTGAVTSHLSSIQPSAAVLDLSGASWKKLPKSSWTDRMKKRINKLYSGSLKLSLNDTQVYTSTR